jgi:hypothetical protein
MSWRVPRNVAPQNLVRACAPRAGWRRFSRGSVVEGQPPVQTSSANRRRLQGGSLPPEANWPNCKGAGFGGQTHTSPHVACAYLASIAPVPVT